MRQMWWDGDPKVKNVTDFWATKKVLISQSSPNHYNPKVEAVQQVNNEVARIWSLILFTSSLGGREMWIGQTSIHNLVTDQIMTSPFTKYTGREIDFSSVCWAPVDSWW